MKCIAVLTILLVISAAEDKCKEKRGLVEYLGYGTYEHQPAHTNTIVLTKHVEVSVPQPYPVTVERRVPYPVRVEVPVPVDRPYVVHVPQPYPVTVERRVPYPVERPVPYPLHVPVNVPVPHPVPVAGPKPVAYPIPASLYAPKPQAVSHGGAHSYSSTSFGGHY